MPEKDYVGRFAPSPSGALHLGSLITAVASFVHARQADGEWLLRIEDIDPPREMPGASDQIVQALDQLELHWDRSVSFQSHRLGDYAALAEDLLQRGLAYRCRCSRKQLRVKGSAAGRYPGHCRDAGIAAASTSIRLRIDGDSSDQFDDLFQGPVSGNVDTQLGDYVIYRRDRFPAYHLAVVLDDHLQGVTHIIRGVDPLAPTFAHRHLQRTLGARTPRYGHIPVLVNAQGQKLSKRTGAHAIDLREPGKLAFQALKLLGADPPSELKFGSPGNLWAWARNHWPMEALKDRESIEV